MWRHYQLQHSSEDEVQHILTSQQTEKKRGINKLRMLGDYFHNVQVLSQKSGQLIVVRRPSSNKQACYSDFLPCVGCKGFFLAQGIVASLQKLRVTADFSTAARNSLSERGFDVDSPSFIHCCKS